eukprot:3484866-Karenia_brevis.AAC.1
MSSAVWAVATSLAVRYKSSPRGLAAKLASATSFAFTALVRDEPNGVAYEQTGSSKADVANGVMDAARN